MLIGLVVLLVASILGVYLWANSVFNRIERVEVSEALSDGSLGTGTNYLIVGSDSREGVSGEVAGQRSDTIVLLHIGGGGAKILSIPRDLFVPIADTGGSQKINAAYNGGPPRLVRTVSQALDVPIHRYVEVDFLSFAGLVDGLGGVTIDFPNPAADPKSGLFVPESGPVELDGEQALAFVRSRTYTEFIDGQEVVDPTADLGRIKRQQQFLQAVFAKLSDTKNPFALASAFSKSAEGLRIDDAMTMFDAFRLAWTLRGGFDPQPLELPVDSGRNESGSVLLLREAEAQPILDQVR